MPASHGRQRTRFLRELQQPHHQRLDVVRVGGAASWPMIGVFASTVVRNH
jgi:hypothetical protein